MKSEELHHILKPLYYACKVFGLAPVPWYGSKHAGRSMSLHWFPTLVWLLGALPCLCCSVMMEKNVISTTMRLVGTTMFYIPTYLSCMANLLATLTVSGSRVAQFLAKMAHVDDALRQLMPNALLFTHTRVIVSAKLLVATIAVVVFGLFDTYSICQEEKLCYFFFLWYLLLMSNKVFVVQVVTFILLLRHKYKLLNRCLMSALPQEKLFSASGNCRELLQAIRQLHAELYDCSVLANSAFGFPLLLTLLWLFTFVLSCLTLLMDTNYHRLNSAGYMVGFIVLSTICLALLATLMLACQLTADEAGKSSVIAQRLLLGRYLDVMVSRDLDRLCIQLQIMRVSFTACGFFTLGLPLFCGIIGAFTTYIVIIAQLK